MPNTHKFIRVGAIVALSTVASPALPQEPGTTAQSTRVDGPQQSVAEQLAEQGFEVVETGRTLLGRVRIVAERDGEVREVVVSRSTGEVMRDAILGAASENPGETHFGITGGEGNSGGENSGGGGGNPGSADG